MRVLILLMAACSAWGQISVTYGATAGTSGQGTVTLNAATSGYWYAFVAPTATTVSGAGYYSTARATANVDSLRAQVVEMLGPQAGTTVTYTDASDIVNLTNNPLANGDVVRFAATTTLPTGIVLNTDYYVCSTAATNFQIDDDPGCASVVTDFSGSSGTQYVVKVISASTTFTPSPVTAVTWIDFSSFSAHTLVAGRKYAVMFINTEAVPATDSVTLGYMGAETPTLNPLLQGGMLSFGVNASAQAFSQIGAGRGTGYVTLGSGVKIGSAVYNVENSSNMRVNGTRKVGAKITTPANISYNVTKIGTQFRSWGGSTYPKDYTMELYSVGVTTDTLIDSCSASLYAGLNSYNAVWCYLSTARALSPATAYRIVVSATGGTGDASNYGIVQSYLYRSGETVDIPLSVAQTYCAATCTTTANWTDEAAKTAPFILGLDETTPYASTGSGVTGGSFVVAQ